MQGVVVSISDIVDEPPSDIVLKIDFREGEGSAARPFQMAADLIRALEDLDATLVKSVDSSITTMLIVEDLQKSSIRVFLRNLLMAADDDALKTLDWKPMVGQYLVKAKYAALRWLDADRPALKDLTDEVAQLARDVDIHYIPAPGAPNPTRLVQSLDRLQAVKREFREGEGLTITLDATDYSVDLTKLWTPSETVDVPPGEMELKNDQTITLVVRKPDMLGKTAWQFRLGKRNLTAPITDKDWLDRYGRREIALMPGDALMVILRTVSLFSPKGELLRTEQSIIKVLKVIQNDPSDQGSFVD